jgi:hypothetical protein
MDKAKTKMDREIRDIISKIYINSEENTATDAKSVQRLKADFEELLKIIEDISFEVRFSHDTEYGRIEYGSSCAVALDIIINVRSSKYSMVVQISKLGSFAWLYWRRKWWFGFGGMSYKYRIPKGWSEEMITCISDAIQSYGMRILGDEQLSEEFEGIRHVFATHEEEYATVRDLLFCFDGAH